MNTPLVSRLQPLLADAKRALQAGHHESARAALRRVTAIAPDNLDAHQLLAFSFLQSGAAAEAVSELRVCDRLHPGDPETVMALARALLQTGAEADAERVLREAVRSRRASMPIGCALARLLLGRHQAREALATLDAVAAHAPIRANSDPDQLMLRGHAQMELGRPAEAVDTFRRWLALDPANTDARLRLAAALADDLHATAAETEVRRCLRAGARSPNAIFILARALMGQRRFGEAEACFRQVVHAQPDFTTAQTNLSELVWMRTGDIDAASAEIDRALGVPGPTSSALRIAKARLCLAMRQPQRALTVVETGLARSPSDLPLLRAAANIALQFDGPQARSYAQRALRQAPGDWGALAGAGNAALAVGDAAAALAIADQLCARDPDNGEAIALRADALRMAGDTRYRQALDYTTLVQVSPLDVPPAWPDLRAYIAELARDLDALHVARARPVENSLRGDGTQALLNTNEPPTAALGAFPVAIDGPIRRYMRSLGPGNDPMRRRNTGRYRLNGMWSVRLHAGGFHSNHYHPKGWISSACYIRVPPAVARHHGAGWLKFGEPAFPTRPPLAPEYFVRPAPGLLALFPAYLWHGTVPFTGGQDDTRLTIAFDVIPDSAH